MSVNQFGKVALKALVKTGVVASKIAPPLMMIATVIEAGTAIKRAAEEFKK